MSSNNENDWYEVTFAVPWEVRGVTASQDAINIAVSELAKRVLKAGRGIRNPDIEVQSVRCAGCGEESDGILLVVEKALVGLLLTVEVRARSTEKSERVGVRTIGPQVPDVPLVVVPST
jgi:uncharacterized protein (UPF0212 family)